MNPDKDVLDSFYNQERDDLFTDGWLYSFMQERNVATYVNTGPTLIQVF